MKAIRFLGSSTSKSISVLRKSSARGVESKRFASSATRGIGAGDSARGGERGRAQNVNTGGRLGMEKQEQTEYGSWSNEQLIARVTELEAQLKKQNAR